MHRPLPRWSLSAAALALLFATSPLRAQTGVLSGRVTDAATARPVPSVQVQIVGGPSASQGVLTNESGAFRFTLAPGTYALVVQSVGFRTQRVDGIQVRAGETSEITVPLESQAVALNEIVVTASRKEEKKTDAPATVAVVSSADVEETPSTTLVSHLYETPGTDIMQTGLQATNVVVRGFNNIFSGALHALTDNRIAGVPSLRVNLLHFIPSTDDDVARMEVVLGPGSALYGPNTHNGVLHIITKSPLTEQGTTVSVAGGERNVFKGMFRTAHLLSDNFGIKLSGQLLRGVEWRYTDPTEVRARQQVEQNPQFVRASLLAQGVPPGEIDAAMARIGIRDFDFQRWAGEVRADWNVTDEATAIFQAGMTSADGLELTGIGAGLTEGWQYRYYQTRFNWNRLFAQLYLNQNDAGETFLVRRGINLVDESTMLVGQLQHGLSFGEMPGGTSRQDFTYGVDYFLTTPKSEGKIQGQYEDDDEIEDVGAYLQSETALSEKFDLILAARVDKSSVLDDPVFSPRAAVVFKPTTDQSFRLTYNRAFSTPSTLNMFLDINAGLAQGIEQLGFFARAQGSGRKGIYFTNPSGGLAGVRSPFNAPQLGGAGAILPATPAQLWQLAVNFLQARGAINAQQAAGFRQLNAGNVGINLLNPVTRTSTPLSAGLPSMDVPPLEENITQTFEAGYQGVLGGRFSLAADAWYTKRDLTSPLVARTPLVLLDCVGLIQMLVTQAGMPQAQAQALACGTEQAPGVARIPLAVVSSPNVVTNTADVVASYINSGEVDYWGWDLGLKAFLTDAWTLSVSSSWVSTDFFGLVGDEEIEDRENLPANSEILSLNAPDFKATVALGYRDQRAGFNAEGRVRHTAEFPVNSADFIGLGCIDDPRFDPATNPVIRECVERATLFDVLLGYRIPRSGAEVQLNIQNLFDSDYTSFVGVPTIGRFAMLQVKYRL